MRKPFITGNWKMHNTIKECKTFADEFIMLYNSSEVVKKDIDIAFCVPYIQIQTMIEKFSDTNIKIGAQNMHFEDNGAYTGEISANMLTEIGTSCCIIGHSERRQYNNETNETCSLKLKKAYSCGIRPILCVGEKLDAREGGKAFDVVSSQINGGLANLSKEEIKNIVFAYEPIWAIGTGKTATSAQAQEMARHIRETVRAIIGDGADEIIIQYGGSVKSDNISEIMSMEDIDGALVGGASLKPDEFIKIINY